MQPTKHTCIIYKLLYHNMCAQPMSAVVLFAAQSEKNLIFQDAIMAEQVPMLSAWFGLLKH